MRTFRIANLGKKANKLHSESNAAVRDKQVSLMQDHECNCSLVWRDTPYRAGRSSRDARVQTRRKTK